MTRHRRWLPRRSLGLGGLAAVIVMTMVAVVGPGPGSGAPGLLAPTTEVVGRSPAVTLYGDSLVVEAERYIVEAASALGWEPVVRAYGGTAPCDWSDELPFDLATTEPAIVVVAFSGNALTPCMTDPTTGKGFVGQGHAEAYLADVTRFVDTIHASGARAALVTPPVTASGGGAALVDLYRRIALTTGAELVDGGRTIAPDGAYTSTMPCLPDETVAVGCDGGRIRVRAADGGHFCPTDPVAVGGVTPSCPVYASGASRYAARLVSPLALP